MAARHLRRLRGALLAAAAVAIAPAAGAGDSADRGRLLRDLAAAVDLPTAAARAAAADALAARADVTLDAWIDAMGAFTPPGAPPAPGAGSESVELTVLDAKETTTIATAVPASRPAAGPGGLLLAFHGQGGAGVEMASAWTAATEASGLVVVAPTEAGPNDGYHFSSRERAAALAALRWARRRFDVDENRIFVTGWSRGGHLAWDLALRHPELFAAVIPVVGAPRVTNQRAENNLRYLENLLDTTVRDLQGSKDDPRALWNVRYAFERLAAWKARDARLIEFSDRGHDADLAAVDWTAFFAATRRDPHPARVIRRAATPGEGRAAWAEILATDATVAEAVAPPQPPGWATMGEDAQRRFIEAAVEKKTARLEVKRSAPNQFDASSAGVARWRLLLGREDADVTKPLTVRWNGRSVTRTLAPSKAVLLREFVERFDRTFLPVAEIGLP